MPAVEAVEPEAREAMKSYWVEHSAGAHTVEAMMLDQGAGKPNQPPLPKPKAHRLQRMRDARA